MAILHLENGTSYSNLEDISRELSALNVNLNKWPVGDNPEIRGLLSEAALDDHQKEQVLESLDGYFQQLQETAGYQSRDLIVLHPDIPNLDSLLAKFEQCHTHADDEVRYIIDGEGVFGFVGVDGGQMELVIEAEEYINVPAGTEHWFHLTDTKRIKAVRYFSNMSGWTPEYTNTKIRISPANSAVVFG
ncbi:MULTISPECIES: 1,2-dihydroxy-3-keto-5-methylthiopentene dioxygenase [Arthrospira]|jgi:1,2-dihydroxy-3-keto-5-methylthiopentene dioxygenase|uniref:Acireductone dioxygenase n=1 Tax=Limnospira platensis NIES-46 TaxID=1236695 RepID=A0A5M3T0P0_LIMPL|nr:MULTISPECIES: cupin domain-containing protein [Arthrospira]AMW29660.1 acireductone dioxygenase [Arthrospira platensis YZ]KDR55754.1 acireductone dioxygenase [Arthrospira platensis str. Paraca]MBD2668157.1 cupin domain-containing protein [Arthrospira platensis FACHB-439]MBD2708716.1 cupin domain-containing protein [Arthrospira platensis FACHB-835]MDF2212371.1 cupin domain-containing protein [Arthrospira platensis NCB002]MDT9293834.1 cupin domain-containing protein [Arthrospira platensis PCC